MTRVTCGGFERLCDAEWHREGKLGLHCVMTTFRVFGVDTADGAQGSGWPQVLFAHLLDALENYAELKRERERESD